MSVPLPAFPTAAACQAFLSPSLCPPSVGPCPYMLPRWHRDMAARQHGRMSAVFECFLALAWKTNIFFIWFFFARGLQHTHCFSEVSEKQSCEMFWLYFVKFGRVLLGKRWTFPPKILHWFWSSLFLLGRDTAEQTCLPPVERQLIYIPAH